jgi:hypothetical protein
MAFYANSESTFTRHHSEEVEMAFSSIDCVLCDAHAIYASTELTTGKRLYDALREHACKTATELREKMGADWFRSNLWNVNVEMAMQFAKSIHGTLTEDSLVITPAPFTAPGWNQQEYLAFWETLLRTRIKSVWFNKNWQFSNGCTFEFAVAHDADLPTYDDQGKSLTLRLGIELVTEAIRRLEADKFDASKLRENLERLLARDPKAREAFLA